jgi:hypothetical protein
VGLHLNEDNVGEFLIDMSRLFQSETIDGINELADVLSLQIATISISILKLCSLGTISLVMTSTPKYLEEFELL